MNTETKTPPALPDLDAMSLEQLREFALSIGTGVPPITAARKLFGAPYKAGYLEALGHLRTYAWTRASLLTFQSLGMPDGAALYAGILSNLYSALPQYAQWRAA